VDNLNQWCFAWFEASRGEGRDRAALWLKAKWTAGQVITISFLEGDPSLHQRIEKVARQWIDAGRANLLFDFRQDTTKTDIRIAFSRPGSWSVLGTTCKSVTDTAEPTMNFGWLTPHSSDAELERVVLHEFGHALGLVHEHQHPAGGIKWNKAAVYADLYPAWSYDKIDRNIFDTIEPAEAAMTSLDPQSIMMYPLKKSWTLDGFSTNLNTKLSPTDITFIRNIY